MSIGTVLVTHLRNDAPLSALVNNRIYSNVPKGLPQGSEIPAITYQQISNIHNFTHAGRGSAQRTRFQFNVHCRTPLEGDAVMTKLIEAFDDFPAVIEMEGPREQADPKTERNFPSLDVLLWHNEP